MSTNTMTGTNTNQHNVQSLNTPVRADEDSEGNLIDPKAVDEPRDIEMGMVRLVYRERSSSLVAGSFFPPAKSGASSGSWELNETNPHSPPNIPSIFPSTMSETDDSSPKFSRSNSASIMLIFPPARSPIDSPKNYEISSIPSNFIMSTFPPARSPIDSPDNYEIIAGNLSTSSYYRCFPPARSEIDSPDNYEIIARNLSIPSHFDCFPPDWSDTDSYGSSTPKQFSIPSLHFPPKKSKFSIPSLHFPPRKSETIKDVVMFKPILKRLQSTLDHLVPTVNEIRQLGLPEVETWSLIEDMKKGENLVRKCSKIPWWNYLSKVYYTPKLKELEDEILRFIQADLQVLSTRNLLKTLETVISINNRMGSFSDVETPTTGSSHVVAGPRDLIVGLDMPIKELQTLLLKEVQLLHQKIAVVVPQPSLDQ